MILFRPTGQKELDLIAGSGWRVWPPRLPDQPIFYPVTTFEYAEKIARDWNSSAPFPNNVGYVTRFEISEAAVEKYPLQLAGGKEHEELWVPSEELDWFNGEIIGPIAVVAKYVDKQRVE